MIDDDGFNPYLAPRSADESVAATAGAGSILHRWERLRLWYNAVLTVETLTVLLFAACFNPVEPAAWAAVIAAAFAADLCFCTGAVAEFYLVKPGFKGPGVTRLLFSIGMVISMLLAGALTLVFTSFFEIND